MLGGLGALAGWGALTTLQTFAGALTGSLAQAFAYVAIGGILSLIVTFGLAAKLHIEEASFITGLVGKVARRLRRR